MGYAESAPAPALRSLVACTWAFSAPGQAQRILPDGCVDIVFFGGRARVVGTMQRAVVVPASPSAVLGVRMRPGEAVRLLPEATHELTDSETALADLWGDDGRRLEDQLAGWLERSTEQRLPPDAILRGASGRIEDALQRRLAAGGGAVDLRVREATALLEAGASVRAAAARLELSERQLGRRFAERVGVNPKTFARVRRLQRAVSGMQRGASPSEAALTVGYADQAHFTREASALAGATPGALLRELSSDLARVIPVRL